MKRMITKLCQLYGVSHYLCMVSMLIWFNHPLLKLSNCAIHLQQCTQLLRISCKKKALFTFTATGITLFIYLFHPCQNLQSGPLHWHIQYRNAILYAFSKTHNKENNIVEVSYKVLAFAKASSLLNPWSSCSYGIKQATNHQLAQRLKMKSCTSYCHLNIPQNNTANCVIHHSCHYKHPAAINWTMLLAVLLVTSANIDILRQSQHQDRWAARSIRHIK